MAKHIINTVPVKQGGARTNSGRHKIDPKEKKQQVNVMIKTGWIEELGGKAEVQKIMIDAVEQAFLAKKISE